MMQTAHRVVDNRVFLLGLDQLYRDAMKEHERGELRECARRVSRVLHLAPANEPLEGYYAEDEELTEYFRIVRALQQVDQGATATVQSLPEFQRLLQVMTAGLFGRPQFNGNLLPVGRDALSQALIDLSPRWTLVELTEAASNAAIQYDDFSLVGLAARVRDPVVLTAARESVVLYSELEFGRQMFVEPRYSWKVDQDLARHAMRFVDAFNALFGHELPAPEPAQAERYWHASDDNQILGRCVRLGSERRGLGAQHYHWAIRQDERGELRAAEFWSPEVWSTTRYHAAIRSGRYPETSL